jgi:hypothetical protein
MTNLLSFSVRTKDAGDRMDKEPALSSGPMRDGCGRGRNLWRSSTRSRNHSRNASPRAHRPSEAATPGAGGGGSRRLGRRRMGHDVQLAAAHLRVTAGAWVGDPRRYRCSKWLVPVHRRCGLRALRALWQGAGPARR